MIIFAYINCKIAEKRKKLENAMKNFAKIFSGGKMQSEILQMQTNSVKIHLL